MDFSGRILHQSNHVGLIRRFRQQPHLGIVVDGGPDVEHRVPAEKRRSYLRPVYYQAGPARGLSPILVIPHSHKGSKYSQNPSARLGVGLHDARFGSHDAVAGIEAVQYIQQ